MRQTQSPPQIEEPLSYVHEKVEQDKLEVSEEEIAPAEIVPIGRGVFGDIYDQFRGKAKEAFDFLIKHKSGDLLGVFHRDGIGDIDLVWGDEKNSNGLGHIIDKHIKQLMILLILMMQLEL